jgi:drug/metabolite transporter (DMT)-like permease
LSLLPAVTVSLLLNLTPVVVALLGVFLLSERPTRLQYAGMLLYLVGIGLYFYPASLGAEQAAGFAVMLVGVLANAGSSLLGRSINRAGTLHPLIVTAASMGIGAPPLLLAGVVTQGVPQITATGWLLVVWLAVVNTALAFSLWNSTLRVLSAVESSIINSTMLVQIALLAWLFLGEPLSGKSIAGIVLAGLGTLIVQFRVR